MTILSPRPLFPTTTDGLNVPAASHPAPRGAITGASDKRCHVPKGRRQVSCAGRAVSNPTSIRTLAYREKTVSMTSLHPRVRLVHDRNFCTQQKRQGRPPAVFFDLQCAILFYFRPTSY